MMRANSMKLSVIFIFMTQMLLNFSYAQEKSINVGVFCSADDKIPPKYKETAHKLGDSLYKKGFGIVTGGSNTGLMKEVMDGYLSNKDAIKAYGVLPDFLKKHNIHHKGILEKNITWTDKIHTRLNTFSDICQSFIVLPGGWGTMHELMDLLVHIQLGVIKKKVILLNQDGYWDGLLIQFATMLKDGALKQNHYDLLQVVTSIEGCLKALHSENTDLNAHQGLEDRFWEAKK